MSDIKYIYDQANKTLENAEGHLFLDNDAQVAKFDNIIEVFKYLKENNLYGVVGKRINMNINN